MKAKEVRDANKALCEYVLELEDDLTYLKDKNARLVEAVAETRKLMCIIEEKEAIIWESSLARDRYYECLDKLTFAEQM